jgi:FKBP-type peptidyl-prolyl cis-trans isomerase
MPRLSITSTNLRPRLLAALAVMGGCSAWGQQFDKGIELRELQENLVIAAERNKALETQLAAAKEQNAALAQSVAAANAEAGQLKESYERLRGLLEGLGIGALENSTDQVQERLITALSDLRLADTQKKKAAEALMALAEATLAYVKTAQSTDDTAKKNLETAMEKTEAALRAANAQGGADVPAKSLHEARVVSLKPEFGVAVLDVGSRDGVKPGMPFEIYREDKPIAKVLVTEVRKAVSGAVVQENMNEKDPIRVGDRGKVSATF